MQAWFERNRAAYDQPALYDFEQFALVDAADAASQEAQARALAEALTTSAAPSEYEANVRQYRRRPGVNLTSVFGDEHGQRLLQSDINHWVPVRSEQSWHLARILQVYAPVPAEFEKVRAQVAKDWSTENTDLQLSRAVKEIADQYELVLTVEPVAAPTASVTTELAQQ